MVRSMSLELRVERLESHFESLDNAVHRLIEITGETQKIVLENQRETRLMFERQDRKIEAYQSENRKRFDQHDKRFDQHDKRFDQHDKRFDQLDKRLDQHDERFDQLDKRLDQHDKRFDQHDERFDKIEKTLAIIVNHVQK